MAVVRIYRQNNYFIIADDATGEVLHSKFAISVMVQPLETNPDVYQFFYANQFNIKAPLQQFFGGEISEFKDNAAPPVFYTNTSFIEFYTGNTSESFAPSSGGVDSVNGQTGVVVLDADDIDDSSTTNKFVEKLYVNLDSAESEVSRVFAAGRTTFTITHNFNTKDVFSTVIRLSNDRRVGWRIEATTVNTVEASRTGNVSDGLFRILLTT